MQINYELVDRVKQAVRAEPKHFDMGMWFTRVFDTDLRGGCGTAACLAGWATCLHERVTLDEGYSRYGSVHALGSAALTDTDPALRFAADTSAFQLAVLNEVEHMFYVARWPDRLYYQYYRAWDADDKAGAAEVALDAMDFFIARAEQILRGEDVDSYRRAHDPVRN